jgi:chromosome partitioning protein
VELERAGSPLLDFSGALGLLAGQVDIAIIDCPPSLGNLTKNALAAADGILVPVQCEYYPMEGLIRLIDLINVVRTDRNDRLSIKGLLLTMYDERAAISAEVEAEIRKHFGDEVLKTVIPRDPALAEAPSYGLPIFEYAARSPGSAAYLGAAKEVLARIGAKEEENG